MDGAFRDIFSDDICVVGNAQSLLHSGHGTEIDLFSTVVRLNLGRPIKHSAQGAKTDVVGLSVSMNRLKFWRFFGRAKLIWMTPKHHNIQSWMEKKKGFYNYPREYWLILSESINGCRPSTGLMILDLICNYIKPKRLRIVGFDFKVTNTWYDEGQNLGSHDWALEARSVAKWIEDGRLRGLDWDVMREP